MSEEWRRLAEIATILAMRQLIGAFIMMPLALIGSLLGGAVVTAIVASRLKWPLSRRPGFLGLLGLASVVMVLAILATLAFATLLMLGGTSEKQAFIASIFTLPFVLPLLAFSLSSSTGRLSTTRRLLLTLVAGASIIAFQMFLLAGLHKARVMHLRIIDADRLRVVGTGLAFYYKEHHEYPGDLRRLVDGHLAGQHHLFPSRSQWYEPGPRRSTNAL